MPTSYLLDTSALARVDRSSVRERVRPLLKEGSAAICGMMELEVLWSARGLRDLAERREELGRLERVGDARSRLRGGEGTHGASRLAR